MIPMRNNIGSSRKKCTSSLSQPLFQAGTKGGVASHKKPAMEKPITWPNTQGKDLGVVKGEALVPFKSFVSSAPDFRSLFGQSQNS